MTAKIKIEMDNAAFEGESAGPELARILRVLADDVEGGLPPRFKGAWDSNGNRVGSFDITGLKNRRA